MKILIVGFGRLGERIVHFTDSSISYIVGLKRKPTIYNNTKLSFVYLDISIDDLSVLKKETFDYIIYCPTPDNYSELSYRNTYYDSLQRVLAVININSLHTFFYISSTSVYAQQDGEWIDENSPTIPTSFSGKIILESEELLKKYTNKYIILRFAGIYGGNSGNRFITSLKNREKVIINNLQYSNRIHIDDCARMILFLIKNNIRQELYIGVDNHPCLLLDMYHWLAESMQVDINSLKESTASSPPVQIREGSNKRCLNTKISNMGFQFLYPSYKEGYKIFL